MSKSIGNVMDPDVVINGGANQKLEPAYGADVIRVWAASTDYTRDVVIGPTTLAAASSTLRKLRNTARFALGNLHDFSAAADLVPTDELPALERYMMHQFAAVSEDLTAAYDDLNFAKVQTLLMQLTSVELSAFYFDVVKDRLYCDKPDAPRRRAAQTVIYHALSLLTKAIAPIAPFTAEDVVEHLPRQLKGPKHTAFRDGWVAPGEDWRDGPLAAQWAVRCSFFSPTLLLAAKTSHLVRNSQILTQVRNEAVTAALDAARKQTLIGSSLEARVILRVPAGSLVADAMATLTTDELAELFIVSQASVLLTEPSSASQPETCSILGMPDGSSVAVGVDVAAAVGSKCDRCWRVQPELFDAPAAEGGAPGALCTRCNFG